MAVESNVPSGATSGFIPTTIPAGGVIFSNGVQLSSNGSAFFWDNPNAYLGIGTATPSRKLHIKSIVTDAPDIGFTNAVPVTWHMGLYLSQDSFAIAKTGTQAYMIIDGNTLASSDGNVVFNTSATGGTSGVFRFHLRGAPVSTDITKQPKQMFCEVNTYNSGDAIFGAAALTATGNLTGITFTASPTSYFIQSFGNNATTGAGADSIMEMATMSTGGDPYYRALVNGASGWAWGAKTSDSQKFYLCNNASANLATNRYLVMDTSGNLGLNTTTPRRRADFLDASNPQIRLTQADNSAYAEALVDSSGNMKWVSTGGVFAFNANPSTTAGGLVQSTSNNATYNSQTACAFTVANATTSPSKIVNFGYDNTNDIGFVYCLHAGTAVKPFMFNVTALGVNTITPRRMVDILNTAAPQARFTYTDNSVYSEIECTSAGVMSFITSGAGGYVFNEAQGDFDFRIEGDSISHLFFTDATATTENIAVFAAAAPAWNTMDRGFFIGDSTQAPTGDPTGGGYFYSEAGALKWRGSSGTITTIAPA